MEITSMSQMASSLGAPLSLLSQNAVELRRFRRNHTPQLTRRPPLTVTAQVKRNVNLRAMATGGPFISISSSTSKETSTLGVTPQIPVPPPPSHVGSPLFWVGVGVGLSALFSWLATNVKKYAMQQAFKSLMGQMGTQNKQFSGNSFSPMQPFQFPTPEPRPITSSPAVSQPAVTVDASPSKVALATKNEEERPGNLKEKAEPKKEYKKNAFVDVSPNEKLQNNHFDSFQNLTERDSSRDVQYKKMTSQNGAVASNQNTDASLGSQSAKEASSVLSVEALEKMMEDPMVQKMVYPYLPEEMRNPSTFKGLLQNPQYRQKLEEMLNNMRGSSVWDNRTMDMFKNFDISSPEVKQQFDQIGLTPEAVISKIMANPDVTTAFHNPRVQAAIMDCSQNPLNISKYQNDKEVMDVFNKISDLFPGVSGS